MMRNVAKAAAALGAGLLVGLAACSGRRGDADSSSATQQGSSAPLQAQFIATDPVIGFIGDLTLAGGQLWVVDLDGEPFFHVLDTTTHKILFSRGRRGTGPTDFRLVDQVFPIGDGSRDVWAFDSNGHRLVRLAPDGQPQPDRSINLQPGLGLMSIVPVGDRWIAWTRSPDSTKRYVGFDEHGAVRLTAPGPLLGDSTVSYRQRLNASGVNLSLCGRPSRDRFALVYGYAGRIEIRGTHAELIALAQVPDSSNGDFVTTRGGARVWHDVKKYYPNCAGTNDYLFALYSGRPTEDPKTGKSLSGSADARYVHVFDWNGRFVRSLTLDRGLTALAVSEDGRWLYGGGYDSASVVRFPLPKIEPKH